MLEHVRELQQALNDYPQGRVYMHPNDPDNSPPGLANAVAGTTWISPISGTATIAGDIWEVTRSLGRDVSWRIELNDSVLTDGLLHSTDPFTSSSPYSFANGSGGSAALMFPVIAGDVVSFELVRASAAGTVVGVDAQISVMSVPESASAISIAIDLILILLLTRPFSISRPIKPTLPSHTTRHLE